MSKIAGIVQCKNEWGLIAVSVSHALAHHVDEVYVLNDASNDQTASGLKHLATMWPGRLHIINTASIGFQQEAMANVVAFLAHQGGADWIYVFDSDEFLLLDDGLSLRQVVAEAGQSAIIQYRVENFVSPEDFDECKIEDYRRIVHRANCNAAYDPITISEKIKAGEATFFDVPFPSKVIYKYCPTIRLRAGAHRAACYASDHVQKYESRIRAVHLPMLTKKRLINKARTGECHIKDNLGPRYGWQNQLIYHLEQDGRLDWFWQRHSIPADGAANALSPEVSNDSSFSVAIAPTLALLQNGFQSPTLSRIGNTTVPDGLGEETTIPIHKTFAIAVMLQRQCDLGHAPKWSNWRRKLEPASFRHWLSKFRN